MNMDRFKEIFSSIESPSPQLLAYVDAVNSYKVVDLNVYDEGHAQRIQHIQDLWNDVSEEEKILFS